MCVMEEQEMVSSNVEIFGMFEIRDTKSRKTITVLRKETFIVPTMSLILKKIWEL